MTTEREAVDTITEACETHGATKVFALFSGGDDSLAALLAAMQHPRFTAAVHLVTGVGVEATTEFARETCRSLRCPLIEYCAKDNVRADGTPDPMIYEQIVMEHGFPGPTKFGHGKMYVQLKERGLRRLQREHVEKGERFILASGCRSEESVRRMGTTQRISRDGSRVWVNHIHDWTKTRTHEYRQAKGLRRNPVSELICKSGECLCGGYGNFGELEELTIHDLTRPLGFHLLDLQKKVTKKFPWEWHEGPPKWWLETKRGQDFLFEMNKYDAPGPMCQGCEKRADEIACAT
jgi:3'-phosphoadenosine 5'-phosphosulfate sulfotransferase (PAPS reductase)/FAD synthetase